MNPRAERAKELQSIIKDPLRAPGGFSVDGSTIAPAELSALMQSRGIPGIKYLNEIARHTGTKDAALPQSSNYVVNDDTLVNIMRKYGLAGATAGTMGALAAQDEYSR